MINFAPTPEQADLRDRIRAFVDREVVPHEPALLTPEGVSWDVVGELRARAREAGIYGPQLPKHLGGLGLDWRGVAVTFEEAGTSLLGPLALNCAAPDEGNMHLLENVATPEQKKKYLEPLAAGQDPLLLRHDRACPRCGRRPDDAPEPRPARMATTG